MSTQKAYQPNSPEAIELAKKYAELLGRKVMLRWTSARTHGGGGGTFTEEKFLITFINGVGLSWYKGARSAYVMGGILYFPPGLEADDFPIRNASYDLEKPGEAVVELNRGPWYQGNKPGSLTVTLEWL